MSKTHCKLLTSAIVGCLHVNQAVPEGTVFNPADFGTEGENEANYLVLHGMAERTSEKANFEGKTKDDGKAHVSGFVENDDATLKTILNGSVADVQKHIDSGVYNLKQIQRLGELNISSDKPRQGVADAVEAYVAANPAE